MSAVVTSIICSLILSITSLYVLKNVMQVKENIINIKNISIISLITIIQTILYNSSYNISYVIGNYILLVIGFKFIFNENMGKTILSTCILLIILILSDFIVSILIMNFIDLEIIRGCWYVRILMNIFVSIFIILIIKIPFISKKCKYFIYKFANKHMPIVILFITLLISIILMGYGITSDFTFNINYISNVVTVLTLIIFCYIFINENNQYNKLNDEYDNLFKYIQVFEDWIEKEQLNRHEYKNQLSSIRCMTKEKKLRDKIDSILLDNINITNDTVNQLKPIPNGGLKGLLYYKISVAESKKIHVELDISMKKSDLIKKMSESNMKTLCRLIGIYLDNAIEAAEETRKKILSIEIYDIDNDINIVIANTFNNKKDISRRNEKGYTTKGKGHGKGLYFAKKMLNKNQWLKEAQSIMDKYYIQRLIIKK